MSYSPIVTGQLPTWGLIFQCYVLRPFDAVCGGSPGKTARVDATSSPVECILLGFLTTAHMSLLWPRMAWLIASLLCKPFSMKRAVIHGLPWWLSSTEPACNSEMLTGDELKSWIRNIPPDEGNRQPSPVFLLEHPMDRGPCPLGFSNVPWCCKWVDTT